MRKLFLVAGLAAAVGLPTFADAASCESNRSTNRAVGTVAGALLGGLAGGAIAGHGSNTAGVLVGGAAGAYAGNQLAKGKPCYTRSYYRSSRTTATSRRVADNDRRCTWEDQAYRGGDGAVVHRQVQICR